MLSSLSLAEGNTHTAGLSISEMQVSLQHSDVHIRRPTGLRFVYLSGFKFRNSSTFESIQ
jgi:hypothetical protein